MICLLRIIKGPSAGQKCWLRDDQNVSIGRLSTSEFPVPLDMHMSRRHMMLEGRGTNFRIRDVGSSNGTFVNGVRVSVAELCNDDRVRAGESVFEVSLHAELPGEDLEFDDPCASPPSPISDSSPTACFTGSLMDDLPVRSVNIRPPARNESSSSALAGQDTSQKRTECPTEIAADGKGHGGVQLPSPQAVAKARAQDFLAELKQKGFDFAASETEGLYLLEWVPESGVQPVVDVLDLAANWFHCYLVLNQSQVSARVVSLTDRLSTSGTARRLSQTLSIIPMDRSGRTNELVKSCLKQDALIMVGALEPRADQWLDSIADVLSYPSMLDGLLKQPNSRLARKLADYADCFVFESVSQRAIKLLLPGLTGDAG